MRKLSDSSRPDYQGETSWEIGSPSANDEAIDFRRIIIKANKTPLIDIFNHYNFPIDKSNRRMTCPFKSHNNGHEQSASFYYYDDTNTFWCFGCKVGNRAVDFVSEYEEISRAKAAFKIIKNFNGSDSVENSNINYDTLDMMVDFSNKVREFRGSNLQSLSYIENVCSAFDKLNTKHNLAPKAMQHLISKLEELLK